MPRPAEKEYAAFYRNYIQLAEGNDACTLLKDQLDEMKCFLEAIPHEKADYAYENGKWSIRILLQHIIDAERIFAFRALWIARGSTAPLPGYDENAFAEQSMTKLPELDALKSELITLRRTTIDLFNSFNAETLQRSGMANESLITVNALGFIIAGHFRHHQQILLDRYLA